MSAAELIHDSDCRLRRHPSEFLKQNRKGRFVSFGPAGRFDVCFVTYSLRWDAFFSRILPPCSE